MSRTRLWRAVNQDGDVLDILVQSRRDNKAAKKFFRKLLQGLRYVPNIIITDKLKSYSVAEAAANTSSRSIRTTEERIRINQKVAGASDEAIQVSWSGSTLSLGFRGYQLPLPTRATSL